MMKSSIKKIINKIYIVEKNLDKNNLYQKEKEIIKVIINSYKKIQNKKS